MLEKQQHNLDIILKKESELCQALIVKINEWKKAVTHEQNLFQKNYNEAMIAIKERDADIAQKKENQKTQHIIVKEVVLNLEKSLSTYFENPKNNNKYLSTIFQFMNERAS